MFESADRDKSLGEDTFQQWLEEGRESKMPYTYLVIMWDAYDNTYKPVYLEERSRIAAYEELRDSTARESFIAAYDLYSESRIS